MTNTWTRSCVSFCEERPDPVNVVEGKSAGSGHRSDVRGAGQSVVEDYVQVPHRRRQYHDILNSDCPYEGSLSPG